MKLSLQHILLESLKPYAHSQKIWVACSGGLDSMVLLDVAREVITKKFDMPIAVLHVNHHLNEAASDWQQLVADYCQQYNIECHAKQLSPENKSTELWAREQRYQFFESMLQNNELLLMAHHQQDNIETFTASVKRLWLRWFKCYS